MALLDITDLTIDLATEDADVELVHELSVHVTSGQTLCLVGESGSGKTVTALSIMRLLEFVAPVYTSGEITIDGVDITKLSSETMRSYRGPGIGMIFQEALDSLNPVRRIGKQLIEAYCPPGSRPRQACRTGTRLHHAARAQASSLLTEVGLEDTDRIMAMYPHQLSGGMQQRVMIAIALMSNPDVLIADEPTTALDVTTQAEILDLLRRVQREHEAACVFITHDMGVAAEISDRIAVMYRGRFVEVGDAHQVLTSPQNAYTKALLECVPQVGVDRRGGFPTISHIASDPEHADTAVAATEIPAKPQQRPSSERTETPELVLDRVSKHYRQSAGILPSRGQAVRAVDDLSLRIAPGEFFGLVGESGSGKSTLGRVVSALERPTSGEITFGSHHCTTRGLAGDERLFRQHVQLIFQDPQSSLEPRHTIARIIGEPLRELTSLRGAQLQQRIAHLLDEVDLPHSSANKLPSQLSGGQRQRVAIARAIATEPHLIVADEPTSALDVSLQGQVMNVLLDLRRRHTISLLFITHDLSLVLSVADRIGVMHHGELVEIDTPERIRTGAAHEYTRTLLAANPDLSHHLPDRSRVGGGE